MYIVKREVKKVQSEEVSYDDIAQFYQSNHNRNTIFAVYVGDKLLTLVSYNDFVDFTKMTNDRELKIYIRQSNNHHIWNDCDESRIETALNKMPLVTYLPMQISEKDGIFACRVTDSPEMFFRDYAILKKKGVHIYRVNIPYKIYNDNPYYDRKHASLDQINWCVAAGDFNPPWYTSLLTDADLTKPTSFVSLCGCHIGNADKKIFLVGPCIAGGWANPKEESLAYILYEGIRKSNLEYEVCPVLQACGRSADTSFILAENIQQNDIVILITHSLHYCELDTRDIYDSYKGKKLLYQNEWPIHTSVTANRLLADAIIEKIIKPDFENRLPHLDKRIVYYGEPQFTSEFEQKIAKFIDKVERLPPPRGCRPNRLNCDELQSVYVGTPLFGRVWCAAGGLSISVCGRRGSF